MPDGGPTEGWDDIGGGQMGAKMFRFLQRDINEGRIWYRHHGGKENSDFFIFEVRRKWWCSVLIKNGRN